MVTVGGTIATPGPQASCRVTCWPSRTQSAPSATPPSLAALLTHLLSPDCRRLSSTVHLLRSAVLSVSVCTRHLSSFLFSFFICSHLSFSSSISISCLLSILRKPVVRSSSALALLEKTTPSRLTTTVPPIYLRLLVSRLLCLSICTPALSLTAETRWALSCASLLALIFAAVPVDSSLLAPVDIARHLSTLLYTRDEQTQKPLLRHRFCLSIRLLMKICVS